MEPHATIGVSEADPLVDEAWRLAAAEQMGTVSMLVIAVVVVWRLMSKLISRLEAQVETLLTRLIDSIGRLETTVALLSTTVTRLEALLSATVARLDRVETQVEQLKVDHGVRLRVLEGSSESGVRRRVVD